MRKREGTGHRAPVPCPLSPDAVIRGWLGRAVATVMVVALFAVSCAAFWRANEPWHCYARALAALRNHDAEGVEYELLQLASRPDCESHASLLAGWLFLQRGMPEQAVEELQFAPDDPQSKALALALIGRACYTLHRFPLAEAALTAALHEDPDEVEAHRWLGVAYYDIGRMPLALAHLSRVAELSPSDPRPHRLIGQVQQEAGEFEKAIESYQESLRRDATQPDRDAIVLDLGRCQVKLHRYDDAIATLASGRETPNAMAVLAECHHVLGRSTEAQRMIDRALAVDPDHAPSLYMASLLAKEAGDRERIVELLKHAVEAHPEVYELRYSLSQALKAVGRDDDAKRELEVAGSLRPIYERLADLKAQAMADTSSAQLRFDIGVLSVQLQMLEAAKGWFEAALALDRHHAAARQALDRLAVEIGRE